MSEKLGPRSANPVDVHVGARVRLRRKILKLSQEIAFSMMVFLQNMADNLTVQLYCLKHQISHLLSMISSIQRTGLASLKRF